MVSCTRGGDPYDKYLKVVNGAVTAEKCPMIMSQGISCVNPSCPVNGQTNSIVCKGGSRFNAQVSCKPPAPPVAPPPMVAEALPNSLVVTIGSDYNQSTVTVIGKCHGQYTKLATSSVYTKTALQDVTIHPDAPINGKIETMVIKFGTSPSGVTLKRTGGTATAVTFEVLFGGIAKVGIAVAEPPAAQPVQAASSLPLPPNGTVDITIQPALTAVSASLGGRYSKLAATDTVYTKADNPRITLKSTGDGGYSIAHTGDHTIATTFSVKKSGNSLNVVMTTTITGTPKTSIVGTAVFLTPAVTIIQPTAAAPAPDYITVTAPSTSPYSGRYNKGLSSTGDLRYTQTPVSTTPRTIRPTSLNGTITSLLVWDNSFKFTLYPAPNSATTFLATASSVSYTAVFGSEAPAAVQVDETCAVDVARFPNYMLVGGGICPSALQKNRACKLACGDNPAFSTITCGPNGTLSSGPVTCPSTCSRHATYNDYLKVNVDGAISTEKCPTPMQNGVSCANPSCPASLYTPSIKCNSGTSLAAAPGPAVSCVVPMQAAAVIPAPGTVVAATPSEVDSIFVTLSASYTKFHGQYKKSTQSATTYTHVDPAKQTYTIVGGGAKMELRENTTLSLNLVRRSTTSDTYDVTVPNTAYFGWGAIGSAVLTPAVVPNRAQASPPAPAKCSSVAGYKLLVGSALSGDCPTLMDVGQSCFAPACSAGTTSRTKITCEAGPNPKTEMWSDPACVTAVPPVQPLKCIVDMQKYRMYKFIGEGGPNSVPSALTQAQKAVQCPPALGVGGTCADPVCPSTGPVASIGKRKTVTCAADGKTTEADEYCDPPPVDVTGCDNQKNALGLVGVPYVAANFSHMGGVDTIDANQCPDKMTTGSHCIQKVCENGKKAKITCTAQQIVQLEYETATCASTAIDPVASDNSCIFSDADAGKYKEYKRVIAGGDETAPCPSPMSLGDVCADLACPASGKRSTIKCEKETDATKAALTMKAADQVRCVFVAPDPVVIVALLEFDTEAAAKLAAQSQTIVAGVKTEVDAVEKTVNTAGENLVKVDTQLTDAKKQLTENPENEALKKTIADLTSKQATASTDLTEARRKESELAEKLRIATETAARDSETAATMRESLAATRANIGGASPSAAATTLECGSLVAAYPDVVCATTGVASLVSINRGTFQVPVRVYKQLDGKWVGYGIAPGAGAAQGAGAAPPWKGVYVMIQPSVSRGVPHSVTCVWQYPPPSPATTVAYTTGVRGILIGTLEQYPLLPTVPEPGSLIPTSTSITLLSGNQGEDPLPSWSVVTTLSAPIAPASSSSSSSGLSTDAIVGIVIGCVAVVALIIIVGVLLAKRGSARVSDYGHRD